MHGGKQRMSVVITVPHAVCDERKPRSRHTCDFAAPAAAEALRRELGSIATVVPASINRERVDMNRPAGRDLPERRAAFAMRPDFVLDVHSFDDGAPLYAGCDIVLMDIEPLQPSTLALLAELRRAIGKRAGFAYGSHANDILEEMRSAGVPAVLVEFSETADVESAARTVAEAVVRCCLDRRRV
jgi:hypothetical protein